MAIASCGLRRTVSSWTERYHMEPSTEHVVPMQSSSNAGLRPPMVVPVLLCSDLKCSIYLLTVMELCKTARENRWYTQWTALVWLIIRAMPERGIKQSINQSNNQSIKQSINQTINQTIKQSNNQTINQSINQTIKQSIKQSNNQSMKQSSINQTSSQSKNQSNNQSNKQSNNQKNNQSNKQTINQWSNQ